MKRLGLLAILLLVSGCVQMVHELKSDPAIVGITGFWVSLGVEASPSSGGIPFPSLKFGHGTIWRVGVTDEVTVQVGEGFNSDEKGGDVKSPNVNLGGQASLFIKTKGTSKALEKMKDLYQQGLQQERTKGGN